MFADILTLSIHRLASHTTSRFAPAPTNPIAFTMLLFFNKIHPIRCTALPCAFGLVPMRNVPKQFANFAGEPSRITTLFPTRHIGFPTV